MPTVVTYQSFIDTPILNGAFSDEAQYPPLVVEGVLDQSELELKECYWGQYHILAITYLTAHRLTRLKKQGIIGSGSGGTIPQELQQWIDPSSVVTNLAASQGSNNVSFSPQDNSSKTEPYNPSKIGAAEDLPSTIWGTMFLSLPQVSLAIGFTL